MSNLPSIFRSPRGEAEHMAADEASSRSVIDLSPRARQVSFWAAVIAIASFVPYFAALAWYMAAGFSPPPPTMTRILASVSVFIGEPALVVQVAGLASQSRPKTDVLARLSMVFMLIFAGLAVSSRILQLIVILGGGAGTSPLDLYVANSPAQWIEFLAWGPCLGLGFLFVSRMFASSGLSGWARRLFVLAGILAIVGGVISMLGNLLSASSIQSVGLLVSLPAWTILLLAAEAMTAWLLRGRGHPSEALPARPVSG